MSTHWEVSVVGRRTSRRRFPPPRTPCSRYCKSVLLKCSCCVFTTFRALSTFRKETDDGDELELHGAEVAALMNLVVTDTLVEEAVALIPSLSRFPEAAVEEILDLIRGTMLRIKGD